MEPYPVNFNTRPSISFYPLAPSFALDVLNRAAKEWIGLIAYRLMGKTDALFPGIVVAAEAASTPVKPLRKSPGSLAIFAAIRRA